MEMDISEYTFKVTIRLLVRNVICILPGILVKPRYPLDLTLSLV